MRGSTVFGHPAFPPFILITRVLHKIISDKAEGVIVIPWWPAQLWFLLFKRLISSQPIYFEPDANMLSSPFRNVHPAWNKIFLREVIHQTFLIKDISTLAINVTLASLSEHTLAKYTKLLKLWCYFCLWRIRSVASPHRYRCSFLSTSLSNTGSYSTLNTYRAAISLLSTGEMDSHPLIRRFFKEVAILKS